MPEGKVRRFFNLIFKEDKTESMLIEEALEAARIERAKMNAEKSEKKVGLDPTWENFSKDVDVNIQSTTVTPTKSRNDQVLHLENGIILKLYCSNTHKACYTSTTLIYSKTLEIIQVIYSYSERYNHPKDL